MPVTPGQVWVVTVISFSFPAWLYFALSGHSFAGATFGKRILKLRVATVSGHRLGLRRSFARTALKLAPWELAHIFGFAFAEQLGSQVQSVGLLLANGLILAYVSAAFVTKGKRSIHDFVVGTNVSESAPS